MYKGYGTDSRHLSWLYLFLGGFLTGIILINVWRTPLLQEMDLLSPASLDRLKYLKVDGGGFFLYVLRERLGTVLVLCLLSTTYIGIYAVSAYALWMGALAGVFLSVASIRYGLKGIALVLMGILPQYFLLVPACIMLMDWCYRLSCALYHPGRLPDGTGYGMKRQYLMRKILQLFIIIGVVIIGSVIESYVNPVLLSHFLKIF